MYLMTFRAIEIYLGCYPGSN